jgi:hypothetical protein
VKDQVNSYRGRIRDRIKPSIASVYDIAGKSGQELVAHVEWLIEKVFYMKVSVLFDLLHGQNLICTLAWRKGSRRTL